MPNPLHIWYITVSTIIIVGLLLIFRFAPFFQKERTKNLTIFFIALTGFLIHRSALWLGVPLGAVELDELSVGIIGINSPCAASL
ncbi:MAG: hypothetical protein LBQ05_01790, partial [Christensenellaceae bacterium]|nr:hypothetical protein [Christensenellaceae bacterium]